MKSTSQSEGTPDTIRKPQRMRLIQRFCLVTAILIVSYVTSFFAFRLAAIPFPLAHDNAPETHVVLFSLNTDVHLAIKFFYSPLIAVFPGRVAFPNRHEHENLVDNLMPKTARRVPVRLGTRSGFN